eukprot:scaffold25830_cov162-Cylindrotheca_fusiformis.AAC.10
MAIRDTTTKSTSRVPLTHSRYGWKPLLIGGLLCVLSLRPLWWHAHIDVLPLDELSFSLPHIQQPRQRAIHHPRVLRYDFETDRASQSISESSLPEEFQPAAESYEVGSSSSNEDDDESRTCQVMHDWQTRIFPSCNTVHGINMRPETGSHKCFCFIPVGATGGGDRCAFKIYDSKGEEAVLKIPKYKKDFTESRYEDARKDGVAMERLQASPYVLDIYGYCGLSQVIEPGDAGGNIHDLIKTTRLRRTDSLPTIDRMKILYQLASGVADMHSFEKDGLVSLVHNDICCHQFILAHGIYKLNDFHMARFQRKNKDTNTVCKAPNWYSNYYKLIRSPEEIAFKLKLTKQRDIVLEKSDVYTLGNVMYYVFTMHWLFEDLSNEDAVKAVTEGVRSPFPEKVLESQDRATRAMQKAIEMCWTHDSEKRPAADEVRNFLGSELRAVLGVEELGVVRVDSVEALPKDYSYSDSDFTTMFK